MAPGLIWFLLLYFTAGDNHSTVMFSKDIGDGESVVVLKERLTAPGDAPLRSSIVQGEGAWRITVELHGPGVSPLVLTSMVHVAVPDRRGEFQIIDVFVHRAPSPEVIVACALGEVVGLWHIGVNRRFGSGPDGWALLRPWPADAAPPIIDPAWLLLHMVRGEDRMWRVEMRLKAAPEEVIEWEQVRDSSAWRFRRITPSPLDDALRR